jgi:tetratricopeptide (TPR) repeat protein
MATQIPLSSNRQKKLLVGVVAVLAFTYTAWSAKRFAASVFGDRPELTSLRRAVWLDPTSADYHDHLGRYHALVLRDPASAIAQYTAAVQLNPHSARYWFDLSSAYQVLGDRDNQAHALEQAVAADPTTPDVAWEAANLHLVEGQTDKALHEFSVVMANEPSLTGQAVQFCWRILPDVDALLSTVVPPRTEAYLAFLQLLTTKGDVAGTEKVWAALIKSGQPFERRYALEYMTFLFLHQEVQQATLVWQQSAEKFGLVDYLPSANNLVVNPQFSLDILNGGLDWHYQKQSGVKLTLDPSEFHAGARSLLINFDGPGIRDAGVYQIVPIQPGTAYSFSGYYKSADFEGAGGPHFTIQDLYHQDVLYESDELKDAPAWTSATGEFTTGPECKAVLLEVRRLPEGAPIRGKLWVDDFQLTRK